MLDSHCSRALKTPSERAHTLSEVKVSRQAVLGLTLLAPLGATVAIAAPAHSAGVSTKPHALKLLINGKQLRITQFNGTDYYNPIKASTLHVAARWKGSLSGTGYRS